MSEAVEKINFGPSAINQNTPNWAKWMFRIVFLLSTVATMIIAADPKIPDELKVRIGVYLKGFDVLIFGFSKMFGVEVKENEKHN